MYSPRIKEEYIPLLYRKAKTLRIPMTKLVNQIIAEALRKEEYNDADGTVLARETTLLSQKTVQ